MRKVGSRVRVAFFGTGQFANKTHIPNLMKIDGVDIVAICDINPQALQSTAEQFGISKTYHDAYQLLEEEEFDVLYSVVPAFARTDVEAIAASKGIHIFSEKPQAIKIEIAQHIDAAIQEAGVFSTVGFRERYRPIFQQARQLLLDKEIVHVQFHSFGGFPSRQLVQESVDWHSDFERGGYSAFDWGGHAVDYIRFITGLDIVRAQAFYHHPGDYSNPLSCSFNFSSSNGAIINLNFISAGGRPKDNPWFQVFFEQGYLAIYGYERIEVNQEVVYTTEAFDPWFKQDQTFIEAVRSNDGSQILNDYHDGLFSLAPILAGWESSLCNGKCIEISSFMTL